MRPTLFTIGGVDVQSYGVLLGLALIVGYLLTLTLADRDRMPATPLGTTYVLAAAAAVFAGRCAWLLQHPDEFEGARSVFTLQAGTIAPFVAIASGLFVSAAVVNRRKISVLAWFDVITPGFAIGVCLERVGALLAGSTVGTYAPQLAWAIRYPQDSPVFADHAARLSRLMPTGATESLPVHPAPLYGLALGVIAVALVVHQRKHRRFTGQVFLRYAIYFVLARALIEEWFRADVPAAVMGPLNADQVGALLIAALLGVVHWTRARADPPLRAWEPPPKPAQPKRSKKGGPKGRRNE